MTRHPHKKKKTYRKMIPPLTGTLILAGAFACVSPSRAGAQADSGRVVGTVTDVTGAAIPNATVTITSVENGSIRTVTSNGNGELTVAALPAGSYTAKVQAPGFGSQSAQFTIIVTQAQTLSFKLAPGDTTSSIDVSTEVPLVNTTDVTLGETVGEKEITELPLNGRNSLNLALLTPGVTQGTRTEYGQDTVNRNGGTGGGALSVNGLRSQANNFILDGVDNNDGLQNVILFFPPVDATREFKVATSVAPAQYGRAGGALVISSIRSGTNQIHGSAFEFYRTDKWNANQNYRFQDAPATPNPPFRQAQFGGSLGAPIVKDKLFIFGDYQGTRINNPDGTHYDTVPTALMRQGNFTELLNPTGPNADYTTFPLCVPNAGTLNNNLSANSKGQIYDPLNCTPFPGNIIPTGRLNPATLNYFNAFPLPSRTDRVLQNYFVQNSSTQKYNTFDVRLDYNLSAKNQLFFRTSYDNSTSNNQSELPQQPGHPPLSANGAENFGHDRGYDLGYTRIFSPRFVNEARLAYNRDDYGFAPSNNGINVGSALGIVGETGISGTAGGPLIGGYNNEIEYTGDYGLFAVPQNTYELTDTLTANLGKHTLNVGGTLLRRQVNFFRPISGKGFFFFAGNGMDFTGYETSEMLVAPADNYSIGAQTGYFGNVSQEDALFAQDDFRVSRRLTLNLGIRWDLLTWPYEEHNKQAAFDVATGTVLEAGVNGVPRSIINQNYLNFAPRVGFAYDLTGDGKSALHGGYGIFYFPDYGGISNQLGQQQPFGGSAAYYAFNGFCGTFTGQTATPGTPYHCPAYTSGTAATTPLPGPGIPNFNPNAPSSSFNGLAVDPNNKHSRIQEYNVQLQQQFGPKDVFSAAYVGTYSDRLSTYYNYNTYAIGATTKPFPTLGGITLNEYNGSGNYNGLQLHFEHRATNFTATGAYTWSHALDNSVSAFGGTSPAILLYYNQQANYGNATQDERHVFSSSFVYNLPFGHGQEFMGGANHFVDLAVGGWQINDIVLLSTGQPVDLYAAGSANPGNRPDLIAPIKYPKQSLGYWFDPSSFTSQYIPSVLSTDGQGQYVYTRVGTLARNQVYGPGSRVMNLGVQKNLHVTEGRSLELHVDAFNVFNTANFSNPGNSQQNLNTFGQITSLASNARQIQIAARFVF